MQVFDRFKRNCIIQLICHLLTTNLMSTESSKKVDYINAEFHVHEKNILMPKENMYLKRKYLDNILHYYL